MTTNFADTPKSLVSGVRLTWQERAIAIKLGNGNISQGVRYALRLAADERTFSDITFCGTNGSIT
jgi:hypothetical protein